MANDNEPLLERVKRFDAGTELGPRVVLAGIVEGTGPLAGPTDDNTWHYNYTPLFAILMAPLADPPRGIHTPGMLPYAWTAGIW